MYYIYIEREIERDICMCINELNGRWAELDLLPESTK